MCTRACIKSVAFYEMRQLDIVAIFVMKDTEWLSGRIHEMHLYYIIMERYRFFVYFICNVNFCTFYNHYHKFVETKCCYYQWYTIVVWNKIYEQWIWHCNNMLRISLMAWACYHQRKIANLPCHVQQSVEKSSILQTHTIKTSAYGKTPREIISVYL